MMFLLGFRYGCAVCALCLSLALCEAFWSSWVTFWRVQDALGFSGRSLVHRSDLIMSGCCAEGDRVSGYVGLVVTGEGYESYDRTYLYIVKSFPR